MTATVLTLKTEDGRASVPQPPDHGPAFRAGLAELGLDVGRLVRIMVALGDPRPRSDLALTLAGQITGRFPVGPEMLCVLGALGCLKTILTGDDAAEPVDTAAMWAAVGA